MIRRPRIYISGPITKGDREHNFAQAAEAQKRLMEAGLTVLNPMLTMKLPGAWDIAHDAWIDNDLPWINVSHAVLRLPGESRGADMEVAHAIQHGIPVFHDERELIEVFGPFQLEIDDEAEITEMPTSGTD